MLADMLVFDFNSVDVTVFCLNNKFLSFCGSFFIPIHIGFLSIDCLSVLVSIQFGLKYLFFRFDSNSDLVYMLVLDFKPTYTTVFCLDNILYNKSLPVCRNLFPSSPIDF